MDKLIRTTSKFKLPNTLSYPIGAEEISRQLQDVPQFDQLSIAFFENTGLFKSDFMKDIKEKKNITILTATYRPAFSGPSMPRYDQNKLHGVDWSIYVFPVPRNMRKTVSIELKEHGMKKVFQWLSSSKNPTWLLNRKQFNVKFDLSKNRINYSEDID